MMEWKPNMTREEYKKYFIDLYSNAKTLQDLRIAVFGAYQANIQGEITDEDFNEIFEKGTMTKELEDALEPWSDEHFTEENDPLIVGRK